MSWFIDMKLCFYDKMDIQEEQLSEGIGEYNRHMIVWQNVSNLHGAIVMLYPEISGERLSNQYGK